MTALWLPFLAPAPAGSGSAAGQRGVRSCTDPRCCRSVAARNEPQRLSVRVGRFRTGPRYSAPVRSGWLPSLAPAPLERGPPGVCHHARRP